MVLGNGPQARRPGPDALPGNAAGRYRLPLRGRSSERQAIDRAFDEASAGQLAVTVIQGDPGIGKTRLLQYAVQRAKDRNWPVFALAPDVNSAMSPLGALIEAAERTEPPLVAEDDLASLMRGMAPQYWLTRLIEDGLEVAAGSSGVLVAVDDLQWLDPGSLGALTSMLKDLQGIPIYWLFATRAGVFTPAHQRFMSLLASFSSPVRLPPLGDEAVDEIARDVLGTKPGPKVEKAMGRAAGSPLVVIELLRGLEEEGLLKSAPGVVDIEADAIPASFGTSARERLTQVSGGALRIAQVGSLFGREFPLSAVLDIVGRSAAQAATPVQELVDHGFIVDTGTSFAFRHDTVQFAAADSLSPTLRTAMTREVLYSRLRAGERPAALASTIAAIVEAGDEGSLELLVTAAKQLAPTDMQGATELATLAARAAAGKARHAEQVATLMPIILAGGPVSEALEVSRSLTPLLSAESRARASLAIARRLTESDFAAAITETATALARADVPDAIRVELLAVRALNYANIADAEGLRSTLDQARAIADDDRDGLALATIDASESVLLWYQGQFDAAQRLQRQALDRLVRVKMSPALWLPEGLWMAFMRNSLGHGEEALALTEAGLLEAGASKNVVAEAFWMMVRCRVLYDLARLDEARTQAETVLDLATQLGLGDFTNATAGVVLHRISLHTGDMKLREMSKPLMQRLADGAGLTRTGRWSLALDALDAGLPALAFEYANLALATLMDPSPSMTTPSDFGDDIALVTICSAVEDDEAVALSIEKTASRVRLNPLNTLADAVAIATRGIGTQSLDDLNSAAAKLASESRPLVHARVLEAAGGLADGVAGVATLREALAVYDKLGAHRDADRVLRALRDRGVRTRLKSSNTNDGPLGLTQREQQVAARVAAGLTTQQIADDLLLSPHTVVAHIRHIFAKWGVNTRREVAERHRAVTTGSAGT